MKLYEMSLSPNCRRVRAVANELGIELELIPVNMMQGEHRQPAYLEKNPNAKVPVLQDGDLFLWESNAIITYLGSLKPESGLVPSTPWERANLDRWMFWNSAHLGQAVNIILYERVIKSWMAMGEPDEKKVESALHDLNRFVNVLNEHLAHQQYIANNQLSVADFSILANLALHTMIGVDLSHYPHVLRWLGEMESRESWKKSEPVMPGA